MVRTVKEVKKLKEEKGLPTITKEQPSSEQRKEEGQAFISKREKLASQTGVSSKRAAQALVPGEEAKLKEQSAEEEKTRLQEEQKLREEKVPEAIGSEQLRTELQGNIDNPLSLKPDPLMTSDEYLSLIPQTGITGQFRQTTSQSARLLENPKKELIKIGVAVGAGSLVGGLSLGALSAIIGKASIAGSVGATVGSMKGIALSIGGLVVGGKAIDIKGSEITSYKAQISKIPGESSTILSAVQNGMPVEDGIEQLRILSESVNEAERTIKLAGMYNLKFRLGKDYIAIQEQIKDARLNIIERVGGVENLAITGRAGLDPEKLLYDVSQLDNSVTK